MSTLKFLIIQLRQIGDVLISTAVCETLKRNYPEAQVDYAVYPYAADVARNNPYIDNLIIIPNGMRNHALWKFYKALRFIRQQRYDYVVELLNTPKAINLAKLANANCVIGRKTEKARTKRYDLAIAKDDTFLHDADACGSVKNRLLLLTGINKSLQFHLQYHIYLTKTEIQTTQQSLQKKGIDLHKPLFFFSMGSRSPDSKQWPLENFISVINHCIQHYDAQIITCPGPGEESENNHIKGRICKPSHYFSCTNTTIREVSAIINGCTVFVGNDSGPRHIAIAVDTPSVAIFSPVINHHDWHIPNHPQHKAINIQDALKLSDSAYQAIRNQENTAAIQKNYQYLTPKLVEDSIAELINQS